MCHWHCVHTQRDLILLGAKYSPCMRRDAQIEALISEQYDVERGSACCIYHDKSGCVQTISDDSGICSVNKFSPLQTLPHPSITSFIGIDVARIWYWGYTSTLHCIQILLATIAKHYSCFFLFSCEILAT